VSAITVLAAIARRVSKCISFIASLEGARCQWQVQLAVVYCRLARVLSGGRAGIHGRE